MEAPKQLDPSTVTTSAKHGGFLKKELILRICNKNSLKTLSFPRRRESRGTQLGFVIYPKKGTKEAKKSLQNL
jgi:hypothetical protein